MKYIIFFIVLFSMFGCSNQKSYRKETVITTQVTEDGEIETITEERVSK